MAQPPIGWVPRRQVNVDDLRRSGRAHLLVGPRQAGKSSLVWSLLRELERPLYLNMEEATLRRWCDSATGFRADLDGLGRLDALFLEEAQWLSGAALFVKGLIDLKVPFPVIVTGSASFHLVDRFRESLAGRADRHVLLPLSLDELVPPDDAAALVRAERRRDVLQRMLVHGSYPGVWTSDRPERLLGDLFQASVLRDASDLFHVERIDAFERLLRLCAHQAGNLVNQSELAGVCGISVSTVSRYLSMMEQAHVLHLVPPFAGGRRRELTSARKVFYVDLGLRNAVIGRFDPAMPGSQDRGARLEGLVYSELRKWVPWERPIRYWQSKSGAEMDFVIERPDGLLAVEVKATALRRPTLTRSSRSFLDAYEPKRLFVVNGALEHREQVGATEVCWVTPQELSEALA